MQANIKFIMANFVYSSLNNVLRETMLTIVHTISKNGHWVSLFANEDEAKKIKGKPLYCYKRSRIACVDLEGSLSGQG